MWSFLCRLQRVRTDRRGQRGGHLHINTTAPGQEARVRVHFGELSI